MRQAVALDLSRPWRLHVVGAGGAGMNPIARVLVGMGHQVSGSDLVASARLERLRSLGVEVHVGHRALNVPTAADAVIVSSAVSATNPEVVEALDRGIPILRRSQALAAIARCRRLIAVAGTHGKTTTSAMLATILVEAGVRPSFIVGGEIVGIGSGAAWEGGEWLVVEADESDGTFLELEPQAAIVTSLEPDHLEHYDSFDGLIAAFDRFMGGVGTGPLIACVDDPLVARLARAHGALTYGTAAGVDYRLVPIESGRHAVHGAIERRGLLLGTVSVPMAGIYNALNATGALSAALALGVPFALAARSLSRFAGVARRFQLRGERNGVTYIDDYAHLPTEVAAALAAARQGRWRRIVCVFQPHRYSRTACLWADFAHAFTDADVLIVTDVYAAGEVPRADVTGELIVSAVRDAHPDMDVTWLPRRDEQLAYLRQLLTPGDLCLTLGAGDLTTLPDQLMAPSEPSAERETIWGANA